MDALFLNSICESMTLKILYKKHKNYSDHNTGIAGHKPVVCIVNIAQLMRNMLIFIFLFKLTIFFS